MSNRVEELESKVAELQAAVNGLTEELVETKERVRLLEDQVEVDLAAGTRPVGHAPAQQSEPEPSESEPSEPTDEAAEASNAAEDDEKLNLRESPAQAQSRAETSAQPSDDASFIDADAPTRSASPADEADASDAEPTDAEDDAVKSEESESTDEAESAADDSDIIVA